MPISEPTAVFSIRDDRDMEIKQAVLQVYRALEEKGYNPINQLVGYILSEDPTCAGEIGIQFHTASQLRYSAGS